MFLGTSPRPGYAHRAGAIDAHAALALAALCFLALLAVLAWTTRKVAAQEGARAGPRAAGHRTAETPPARSPAVGSAATSARIPVEAGEASTARRPAHTSLAGTVRIDGEAPWRTYLRLRATDGSWEGAATADSDGRFAVADVPAVPLRVELTPEQGRMEAVEGRVLLLPEVAVTPALGETPLELDWTSRHVNVVVVDEAPLVMPARVEVEGPGYATSVLTDEGGKARIALVGGGSFVFRTTLPTGRSGSAALDLDESEELDTVVVSTATR